MVVVVVVGRFLMLLLYPLRVCGRARLQDFYAALDVTSASVLKADLVEKPNVSFDDIGGMEDVKTALKNLVRLPVDHMDKFEKMGLEVRRGCTVQT